MSNEVENIVSASTTKTHLIEENILLTGIYHSFWFGDCIPFKKVEFWVQHI